ncbi:unnamed protein product [Rangifer tarandus platyrhynchus]|uniref:Secreted protein n=2 Tax=Rangifer tarandus platyrhynchus TaxID=3082113 RepID=A0ABN8YCR8_RANTA|nr:unnamed protein product [Rangifer tarandus platyrhynchus]
MGRSCILFLFSFFTGTRFWKGPTVPAFTPSVKHRARKRAVELTQQVSCDSCFSVFGRFVCSFLFTSPSRRNCHGLRFLSQDGTQGPKSKSKCMSSLLYLQ